ncbi:MAG: hypothetical protein R2818_12440 [Flavobacteriales bacterium]
MRWTSLLFPLLFVACAGPSGSDADACSRYFVPYEDHVSQRERNTLNNDYMDAMALYRKADYAGARDGLVQYLSRKGGEKSAYMYLACCYLALGEPFEAELQLDHLERSSTLQYSDQVEWYTVLCWLCSDQLPRARKGAEVIAGKKAHTYRAEAIRLMKELGAQD